MCGGFRKARARAQHLHGDVEPGHVEGLEHDFSGVLTVLRRVERRLGQQEVVLLGLAPEILEHAALPKALHVVPILHESVANRIIDRVGRRVLHRLVADVEVKILRRPGGARWARLGRVLRDGARGARHPPETPGSHLDTVAFRVGSAFGCLRRDESRQDVLRLGVARVSHFGVPRAIIDDNGGVVHRDARSSEPAAKRACPQSVPSERPSGEAGASRRRDPCDAAKKSLRTWVQALGTQPGDHADHSRAIRVARTRISHEE